ncbi:MAG: MmgE/PrpD family protein [Chloroflexota bacterium]|mgnify:CR=1 FL=1
MTDPVAQTIARHIVDCRFEDLPPEAVHATKEHILHTLATVLAGSGAAGCTELLEYARSVGGRGESTVLVSGTRLPAAYAAMVNSAMGHAQEFDNNDDRIAYKSSVCAVPAGLAMAEQVGGVSGKAFLTAVCIGIDVGIRVGLGIEPQPAHPVPSMLGPFAAAAAAAKLLITDPETVESALGIALCGVSDTGLSASGRSHTKRLLAGMATYNGVFAAQLAGHGFLAQQDVFQGPRGYYKVAFGREGNPEAITKDLGKVFEVVNVGPKGYPSCRYTHPALDATLALVRRYDVRPDAIAGVHVTLSRRDYDAVWGGHPPATDVDAQFSIQYAVAAALSHGQFFLEETHESSWRDPAILQLQQRITAEVDPGYDKWFLEVKPAQVTITLPDGRQVAQRIDYAKGHPLNPVPWAEIQENFMRCGRWASPPLSDSALLRARDLVEHLEDAPDLRERARLLRS